MIELEVQADNLDELVMFIEHRLLDLLKEGYLSGYNWSLSGEDEPTLFECEECEHTWKAEEISTCPKCESEFTSTVEDE